MTRIIISHAHSDAKIAKALVDYLDAALNLTDGDILCTSQVGLGLGFGLPINEQLKEHLRKTEAIIGLITKDSLLSNWVLFELGSGWVNDKVVIPILGPSLTNENLPGPLQACIPVGVEDKTVSYQMSESIQQLASELNIKEKPGTRKQEKRDEFIEALKNWKSQRTSPEQQKIKELKEKIETWEQSDKQQKEEIEILKNRLQETKRLTPEQRRRNTIQNNLLAAKAIQIILELSNYEFAEAMKEPLKERGEKLNNVEWASFIEPENNNLPSRQRSQDILDAAIEILKQQVNNQ